MAVIKIVPMPGAVGDKGDEGAVGPQGQQGETGLQGPAGADALWSYNGEWQVNSSYATGDVVTYQGQLYYTKSVTTAGTLPTDITKFDLIASKGADGQPGANGTNGADGTNGTNGTNGADALWNYTGEYSGGASYAVGDVVTFDGQLWYRKNSNGGNVGDTPSEGLFWDLLAAKGVDGNSADIADFVFTLTNSESPYETNSSMTILDHDMRIRTEKSNDQIVDADISIQSADNVTITAEAHITMFGSNGEFLGNSAIPENQIATIGDISNAAPLETSFTVNGGTLGTQPTFNGAPLFSGTYVVNGPMVHFQIQVDMDNILTFGDGQYVIDLPFPAKYGYQFKEGCLHDISSGKQYAIGGHVYAGQSQMALTFTNSAGQDDPFDYNSPVVLATTDNFHISGTYISE
jgi:hypothetical protein